MKDTVYDSELMESLCFSLKYYIGKIANIENSLSKLIDFIFRSSKSVNINYKKEKPFTASLYYF